MLLLLLTIFLSSAQAGNAPIFEKEHGSKLVVQYFIYNAGLHALVLQEKQDDGSPKELQKIRMFFKKEEFLTNQYSFLCLTKEKEIVYAVATKKKASRKKPFKPSRGWVVDDLSSQLRLVEAPALVSCKWAPQGEEKYPFK